MTQNLFIIGNVASGKRTLLEKLKNKYNLNVLDTGKLFRFLSLTICNETDINPDYLKLSKDDVQEEERIINAIYKRNRTLTKLLQKLKVIDGKLILNGEQIDEEKLYSKEVNSILPIVSESNFLRKKILRYINKNFNERKGKYAITGHTLEEMDTSKFTTIFLDVKEEKAAERLYKRNPSAYDNILSAYKEVVNTNEKTNINTTKEALKGLYNYIYVDTTELSEEEVERTIEQKLEKIENKDNSFSNLQDNKSIERQDFEWILNPFLTVIKEAFLDKKIDEFLKNNTTINKTDLEYQTLIKLCSYNLNQLFNGNVEYLNMIDKDMENRNTKEFRQFAQKVIDKDIQINEELINKEILLQVAKLEKMYKNNNSEKIMTCLNTNNAKKDVSLDDVIYKKVDKEISEFLAKNCHYLHTPRNDEFASYGAFIEGEVLPIAWVSYSKQDREYKKQLLNYLGIESQNTLEMTRAWNTDGAPKNLMSSLFQYSIDELQKEWKELKKQGKVNNTLQAITTAINPNLGFKASAFLGSNFIPFALRPAKFTYGKQGGNAEYMTRREIERRNLEYLENKINILPLNELILCLNKEKQQEIKEGKIHIIEDKTYNKVLEERGR